MLICLIPKIQLNYCMLEACIVGIDFWHKSKIKLGLFQKEIKESHMDSFIFEIPDPTPNTQ